MFLWDLLRELDEIHIALHLHRRCIVTWSLVWTHAIIFICCKMGYPSLFLELSVFQALDIHSCIDDLCLALAAALGPPVLSQQPGFPTMCGNLYDTNRRDFFLVSVAADIVHSSPLDPELVA
mmetsp:Transcript_3764/g.8848  ORF Transcript_3764/g.8848 Transcript_3764/m.8848 type:complete len:122 (+) Transcript_3764:988-1353(+)